MYYAYNVGDSQTRPVRVPKHNYVMKWFRDVTKQFTLICRDEEIALTTDVFVVSSIANRVRSNVSALEFIMINLHSELFENFSLSCEMIWISIKTGIFWIRLSIFSAYFRCDYLFPMMTETWRINNRKF